MNEVWADVAGWPGYEVSTLGRVRSWKRLGPGRRSFIDRSRTPKILRSCKRNGYPSVLLMQDGVFRQWFSIHRLVLETFVGPAPSPQHQGAHGDGNRTNNRLNNLRWATPAQNNHDKHRHGTHQAGVKVGTAKLTDVDVSLIRQRRLAGVGVKFLAREFRVCRNTITNLTTGKTWRHLASASSRPAAKETSNAA